MNIVHDFDESVLASLEKIGGIILVQRMLELFLEHAPKRLALARAGFVEGDLDVISRAAHLLKSTAGHMHMGRMQELADLIEHLALTQQHDAIAEPLQEIEAAFTRVAPIITMYRDKLNL